MSDDIYDSDVLPLIAWSRPCNCSNDLRWLVSSNLNNVVFIALKRRTASLAYTLPEGFPAHRRR